MGTAREYARRAVSRGAVSGVSPVPATSECSAADRSGPTATAGEGDRLPREESAAHDAGMGRLARQYAAAQASGTVAGQRLPVGPRPDLRRDGDRAYRNGR